MSGIVNKVKEVLHGHPAETTTTTTVTTTGTHHHGHDHAGHTAGPHTTDTANKLDPRVDSDQDGSRNAGMTGNTYGTTGDAYGTTGMAGVGTTGTHHHHGGHHDHAGYTAGPHTTDTANKLDPRVDSDRDGSRNAGMTGAYGTTGTAGSNTVPHNSSLLNKLDPRVDTSGTHATGAGTTGAGYGSTTGTGGYDNNANPNYYSSDTTTTGGEGPHSSSIANRLDPRVDSTTGTSNTGMGYGSNTATTGTTAGMGTAGAGPHSSSLANKLDPRIDSTTGTSNVGTGYSANPGNTGGAYGTTGTGMTGNTANGGYGGGQTAGPHSSNLMNKLDPRVDSTTGASNVNSGYGTNTGTTGTTGAGYGSTGTTGAGYGNTGTTGSGMTGNTTSGYGTSASGKTVGPHRSDLLNKLDPRVDSTGTGNAGRVDGATGKDTFDAAQVPPSQFQREEGHYMSTMGSKRGSAV